MFTDLSVYIIVPIFCVLGIILFFIGYFGTVCIIYINIIEFFNKIRRTLLKFNIRLWKFI